MNNWRSGDEAICIRAGAWWRRTSFFGIGTKRFIQHGPRKGERFMVLRVVLAEDELYLELDRFPLEGWHAEAFRKPDKHEGSKRSWADMLKRHGRKVSA